MDAGQAVQDYLARWDVAELAVLLHIDERAAAYWVWLRWMIRRGAFAADGQSEPIAFG